MTTRLHVTAHDWSDQLQRPLGFIFVGVAETQDEAQKMVADHAAARGTPCDHRYYSISTAPYPDPHSYARDVVRQMVNRGKSLEDILHSVLYVGREGYRYSFHGPNGFVACYGGTQRVVPPGRMYAEIGNEWGSFDIRMLYTEAVFGMHQAALL